MSKEQNHDQSPGLSQNQVESLVRAMETAEPCEARPSATPLSHDPDPQLANAITDLHRTIASSLSRELGTTLRTVVDVTVADVAEVAFAEYERTSQPHSWTSVLSPKSLRGDWCLDVSPQLCCLIVDRMLGGEPMPGETFNRPMTDIERRLVQRVVDNSLHAMLQVWQTVDDISWIARHQEPDGQALSRIAGDERILVVSYAVSMCGAQSDMRVCLPVGSLNPIREKLCEQNWDHHEPGAAPDQLSNNLAAAGVDVAVTLARSSIKSSDLLDLRVGDIIATEKETHETLEMSVQHVPKFQTRAGSLNGKKAVQIQSDISKPRDG